VTKTAPSSSSAAPVRGSTRSKRHRAEVFVDHFAAHPGELRPVEEIDEID
jgi:hypothetical protein